MNCTVHPEIPAKAPCDRCGNFSCAACLSPVNGKDVCAACRERLSVLPWDRRDELGTWRAWWQTAVLLLKAPIETLDRTNPDSGTTGGSILYTLISAIFGYGPTFVLYGLGIMVVFAAGGLAGKGEAKLPMAAGMGVGVGVFVFYVLFAAGALVVSAYVVSGIELLVLRLFGARHASYPVQVRCHALSMSPNLLGLVPICGLYIFPIWGLVIRIFATQRLQKVSTGLAVGAVLGPIAVCCVGVMGLYAIIVGAALAAGGKL